MREFIYIFALTINYLTCENAFSQEIIEELIKQPETRCSRVKCVELAPGLVGMFKHNFMNKRLAFGTLNRATNIAGVKVPSGHKVVFKGPMESNYFSTQFSIFLKADTTISGVLFREGTEVSFDRFYAKWDSENRVHQWIPHESGVVRVYGKAGSQNEIENFTLKSDSLIGFEVNVSFLDQNNLEKVNLTRGHTATETIYPSNRPFHIKENSFFSIFNGKIRIENHGGFTMLSEGLLDVSQVIYDTTTGIPISAYSRNFSQVEGYQLQYGEVFFHPSGSLQMFQPREDYYQKIGGIGIDGSIGYRSEVKLWPNGNPMVVHSRLVNDNREYLPEALLDVLPNLLSESGRIVFFINPEGDVRALSIYEKIGAYSQGNRVEIFKEYAWDKAMQDLRELSNEQDKKLEKAISRSRRTNIDKYLVEFLEQN